MLRLWLPTCTRRPVSFETLHHLQRFGDGVRHGLLAVDVLAGLHGGDGDGRVPVVGGGDQDGVDVLAVEHLPIVARGRRVGLNFLGAAEVAVVEVADHGHVAPDGQDRPHVFEAADSCPDHSHGDGFVGRAHGAHGAGWARGQRDACRRSARHGALDELTPRDWITGHGNVSPFHSFLTVHLSTPVAGKRHRISV